MGFFDSDASTRQTSTSQAFSEIAGPALALNSGGKKSNTTVNFKVDSEPALKLAGEAVRGSTNLAQDVTRRSQETARTSQQAFTQGLKDIAAQAVTDSGDQIATILKFGIGAAVIAVGIKAFSGGKK